MRISNLYAKHSRLKERVGHAYYNYGRGLLSHSFELYNELNTFSSTETAKSHFACLKVSNDGHELNEGLPSNGCLILSPSLFWKSNVGLFYKDPDVVKTMRSFLCRSSFCVRDLFLGMPLDGTGIKSSYDQNVPLFNLYYGLTLFAAKIDNSTADSLRTHLLRKFSFLNLSPHQDSFFKHVFYRPRKYFASFLPLILSYVLLVFYLYFSVSKIIMVKSKWGLALAAVVTVAATSIMTAGICVQFSMLPTLWGAELFPYLALVVGLENTLCLTRSVVYTPPAMDVRSRISHGLSQEGYSFTKYFLLEMAFLFVGFLTFVSEIQEFCVFAWIGLVIDFYMQLFFYAPCLTLDLLRLDPEEKQRFSSMLFFSDIRQYKNYSNPK
ncbi:unnamed protein product [Enterobius vermicularis]|uniref:SSD domain-containing protein n=1 Tax=Enterobius vermicularis TaxID=51028 RepID=A0A0N4VKB2_ENTVE|nr:unnamed protein product [Enterobius vermicularis]